MTEHEPAAYTHRARIAVRMSRKDALVVAGALAPETEDLPRARSGMKITDDGLELDVSAHDASSLRAAINSNLRWIRVAMEVSGVKTQ